LQFVHFTTPVIKLFIFLFNIKAKGPEGLLHCSTQNIYNSTRLLTWAMLLSS